MIKSIFYFAGALSAVLALAGPVLAAPTETVLYRFQGGTDGAAPTASLLSDHMGGFYTTTVGGGSGCCGTIIRLSKPVAGVPGWRETVLHSFQGGTDGANPYAGLIADAGGSLYTTTENGGGSGCSGGGCGTVVRLSPPLGAATTWTETILYSFQGNVVGVKLDGANPFAGLTADAAGNLFTTTFGGGGDGCFGGGCGTIVMLSPPATGQAYWVETVLHSFHGGKGGAPGGAWPNAGLIIKARNLYMAVGNFTRIQSAADGRGLIVRLSPPAAGASTWKLSDSYVFSGAEDGDGPQGDLIADRAGSFYAATLGGGSGAGCPNRSCGTIVKLTPGARTSAPWTDTVLYNFQGGADGTYPEASLIMDAAGNLFTTTFNGGGVGCGGYGCGTIIRLSPPAAGASTWTETVLYSFRGGTDGAGPRAGLIADREGRLYTTTEQGGGSGCNGNGCGTIIRLSGTGFVSGE